LSRGANGPACIGLIIGATSGRSRKSQVRIFWHVPAFEFCVSGQIHLSRSRRDA